MKMNEQLEQAQERIKLLEKRLSDSRKQEGNLLDIIGTLDSHLFRCQRKPNGDIVSVFSEGKIANRYNINTDQVKGKTIQEIMGDGPYSRLKSYYDRAFSGETVEYRDFLFEGRNFAMTLRPLTRNSNGEVTEVVGINQDITEIRKSEIETQKMNELLNSIIEHNPYSIQILNTEGYHIRENKAFLELFKTVPDDGWSILKDSQITGGGLNERLQRVLKGEVVETPPIWYNAHLADQKYPDNPVCIGSVIFPVFFAGGGLQFIVLMHEDITERMKAQQALQESEKRMHHLLSTNPAVIYTSEVVSPYKWTFISENVPNLAGYSPQDFLENDNFWSDQVHPHDRQKVIDELPMVFEKGCHLMEYRFRVKNGNYIWILDEVKLICDDKNNPMELIGYWIDITKRKEAARDLVLAKDKAEESDRLKSAFLANMSHEIRTPMNGILGFADLLKDPQLTGEEKEEYVGIIRQSGNRLLNIINDLINISKIESGQMDMKLEETNINEQLAFLTQFFEAETKQKGLQLSVNCFLPDQQAIINADKEKLYAILTNLIKNAIKFTDHGSIDFGYRLNGRYFEFYVKDTGIGISKNMQHSVLERFIQVNSGFSSGYEGAGLGLSISKAYVEMLGGKIWIESELGEGSAFYFTVPAFEENEK